jgi:hypothetical protein
MGRARRPLGSFLVCVRARRNGLSSASYLASVIRVVAERIKNLTGFDERADEGTVNLWLATTALVVRGTGLAEGLGVLLVPRKVRIATGPVFRALFEVFVDFDHVLDHGDPKTNASKFLEALHPPQCARSPARAAPHGPRVHSGPGSRSESRSEIQIRSRSQ